MVFSYNYLSKFHLEGLKSYKYSAIDTSPLSNYVMHPLWNLSVKVIPKWVAPNLITFVGFLFLLADVLVLTILDYHFYTNNIDNKENYLPNWLMIVLGLFLFINYNLDGIDGKQARRIGVSGPLGELFDHGLDSYVVFFIPFCIISVVGRDDMSFGTFGSFRLILSIILNFYVTHCEKYNTGTLYLPWAYDVSMWISTLAFIIPGIYGPDIVKFYLIGNLSVLQAVEMGVHLTSLTTTLPVAIYNVYTHRKKVKSKSSVLEAIRPAVPMVTVVVMLSAWGSLSPNNIMEIHLRPFLFLLGTLFSNISCRLIVSQMSKQRCDAVNWMTWPLLLAVCISVYEPQLEVLTLYTVLIVFILSHVHYGVCVVRQICEFFNISCFTVPAKSK